MKTGVFKAFSVGAIASLRRFRAVLIVWAVNLAAAGLVSAPVIVIIYRRLGSSDMGNLVRPFDVAWLGEMLRQYREAIIPLAGLALTGTILYMLLSVLVKGGFAGRLLSPDGRVDIPSFAADCGRFFQPFLRLFGLSLFFTIAGVGAFWRLTRIAAEAASGRAVTEWPTLILANLHVLLCLLLLSVVRMYLDYARIIMIREGESRALPAVRKAVALLRGRFLRAWALYLVICLLFTAATAAIIRLAQAMASPALPAVILGTLGAQAFVMFRIFAGSLFLTAQSEFLRGGDK